MTDGPSKVCRSCTAPYLGRPRWLICQSRDGGSTGRASCRMLGRSRVGEIPVIYPKCGRTCSSAHQQTFNGVPHDRCRTIDDSATQVTLQLRWSRSEPAATTPSTSTPRERIETLAVPVNGQRVRTDMSPRQGKLRRARAWYRSVTVGDIPAVKSASSSKCVPGATSNGPMSAVPSTVVPLKASAISRRWAPVSGGITKSRCHGWSSAPGSGTSRVSSTNW
jgi:hypothetical protein